MSLELIIIIAFGIVILAMTLKLMLSNRELTTDECVKFLNDRGYYVRLNASPKHKELKE